MRLENESGITVNLDVSGVWVARFFPSFLPFFSLPSFLSSNLPSFFLLTISPLPVMRRDKELHLQSSYYVPDSLYQHYFF